MWSWISKVSQGKLNASFPYEMGEKLDIGEEISPWTLFEGKKQNGGEKVSIFICDFSKVGTDQGNVAKADYKRIKTTRHPNVLKYVDGLETDSNISLVTEHVVPLSKYINEENDRNEYEISWGLHQILKIVSFLNMDCKIIHNNIATTSIFVDQFGDWKLGGFGFAYNDTESPALIPTKVFPALNKYKHYLQDEAKSECWSKDVRAVGSLIWELFNGPLSESSSVNSTMEIPKSLVTYYRKMISPKSQLIPNPRYLIEQCRSSGGFMKNSYVDTNLFLEELQLKDADEKAAFFKSLSDHVDEYPAKFCKQRLLPQLINAFEFAGVGSAVLQPLIKIGRHLSDEEYQEKVIPCIIKLFSSPDRSTRVNLLQQMEFFAKYLNPKVVDTQIYPQLATGFTDTVPALREETIKSMVLLVPKLSEATISKDLLKHFAILQQDELSSIRTNTTICLGKVACHFNEATRKRVLITAFLRAMQDSFPPARIAGILGFTATKSYYSGNDIAEKILPNLCTKILDPEKSVRDQIFSSIRQFLTIMETYSEEMKNESAENGTVNSEQGFAAAAAGTASSWAGWAVNSLTSKIAVKNFDENQISSIKNSSKDDTEAVTNTDDGVKVNKSSHQSEDDRTVKPRKNDSQSDADISVGGWEDINDWDQPSNDNSVNEKVEDWNDIGWGHTFEDNSGVHSKSIQQKKQISNWDTTDWNDNYSQRFSGQKNTTDSGGWDNDEWEPFEEELQSQPSQGATKEPSMPKAQAGHQINKEEKSLSADKKREERRLRHQALKEKRTAGTKKGRPMKLGTVKKSD